MKKLIIKSIGSHYSIYLKKMTIELLPWYRVIKNNNNKMNKNITKFGPSKKSISKVKADDSLVNNPIWQGP
ncbi:MAG: hypothetical protein KGV43_03050 [Arcobacter sp.]|nr:hypothetical protein [Arcobacter sp.]MBS9782758.1 hypothetical protein [Arcobacter sp.]